MYNQFTYPLPINDYNRVLLEPVQTRILHELERRIIQSYQIDFKIKDFTQGEFILKKNC